ncbi:MAG: preprotein translocase subunit YajC [Clostridia bacterium]|nr:preprotein translocase subunit YajC [Clostridia bacterium]
MGNIVSYILIAVLLAGMVALMFVQGSRQKKAQADYLAMLDALRPGVKVKMASGLLGRIKEIREEAPGFKTITLNIGEDKNAVEMTFVIEAVQGIVNEEAINKLNAEKKLAVAEKTVASNIENTESVKADDVAKDVKTSSKKKSASKNK